MFGKNPQKLVHLPRQTQQAPASPSQRNPDLQLPRGECRYILPDVESDGSRQRCSCASFSLNNAVPGSLCGCGHQAWHHVTEPVGNYVPLDEHLALMEKFKKLEDLSRRLQEDLQKERKERDKQFKDMQTMVRGNYHNMGYLKYYVDEKLERLRLAVDDRVSKGLEELEEALDKAHDAAQTAESANTRVSAIDEAVMLLEERLDSGRFQSRSLTPVKEGLAHPGSPPQPPPQSDRAGPGPDLPIRTNTRHLENWDVRVILVPRRFQQFAFSPDGIAFRRCQSRGFHQEVQPPNHTAEAFSKAIEDRFHGILRGRPWMPLQCLKSSDMSLNQLSPREINPKLWNYDFLESQCMAFDKHHGGDVIFIALQNDILSWVEIHALPRQFGSDESCWEHNDELDSKARDDQPMMDYSMEESQIHSRPATAHAAETASMESSYDLASPPPYNYPGRAYSDAGRTLPPLPTHPSSGLDVLANASSYLVKSAAPSISDRSISTMASIDSTLISARAGSMPGSILEGTEYDQHRDKRTKHAALRPHPVSGPSSPAHHQSSPPPSSQPQIIFAGRTKRKLPATGKREKEPMDWRPSEMNIRNPLKKIIHPRQNQDSAAERRPHTSGGASTTSSQQMDAE